MNSITQKFGMSYLKGKLSGLLQKPNHIGPNILLTDTCNQSCKYCFAQAIMKATPMKFMSLANFQIIIDELRQINTKTIRLLGGEPTLHPQFEQIITLASTHFDNILLFTNGLYSKNVASILKKNSKKILLNINIDTPAFESDSLKRKAILNEIDTFSLISTVIISFTLNDLSNSYQQLLGYFTERQLARIHGSFSIAKKEITETPYFRRKNYKALGNHILDIATFLHQKKLRSIVVDCGLQPAMFDKQDLETLKKLVDIKGWGCKGKWGLYDINTNLDVFPCFPKSQSIITRQRYKHLAAVTIPNTRPCV